MCGISGVINFKGITPDNKIALKAVNDAIAHRGPDDGSFFFSEFVGLGHRRLSIVDLSTTANQPMTSELEDVVIVFNGEIYNHAPIREELALKYNFKTDHSDTETIIYAYKEWGIDCIKKLNGMFAFALYDRAKQEMYLVRDRIGQKPIFFTNDKGSLFFASEIHPFFKANILKKSINEEAIYHYLTFLTIPTPNTFFNDVQKLEAGHYLKITKDKTEKIQFWNIADYLNNPIEKTFDVAVKETEAHLKRAMEYRNIADVPITNAISGGLDSSLNVHYSKKINPDITAINISYAVTSEFDESVVAERFCKESNVKFVNKKIDKQLFQDLIIEYLSIQKDMPLGDPNVSLVYYLSKLARQEMNAIVLMVGEGGDEIGGYPKYLKHRDAAKKLGFLPSWAHKMVQSISHPKINKFDFDYEGTIISRSHIHGFTEAEKKRFWNGTGNFNSYKELKSYMDEITVDAKDKYLRQVLNLEYKLRLPEMILSRIDYPSMAASIEARSPFVDHELIEYSAQLSFDNKMKDDNPKAIIKEIGKKLMPDYVLNHPKVGFGQLLTPFLQETLPKWFAKEVLPKDAPINKYVKSEYLKEIHQRHAKTGKDGFKVWILFALNKWLQAHND